jgi:hypothetical protein
MKITFKQVDAIPSLKGRGVAGSGIFDQLINDIAELPSGTKVKVEVPPERKMKAMAGYLRDRSKKIGITHVAFCSRLGGTEVYAEVR